MAAKKENKLTVFLSHSHADIEKVRKVRDVLETLNCEPITFFLACMDDNNPLLEKLIKDEIDARNVFVYCKSKKAKKSKWVQKELEYIKSTGQKRLYEIDLEENFETSVVQLLNELMKIIYSNTVVLCGGKSASPVAEPLKLLLQERGFVTLKYDPTGNNTLERKVEHFSGSGIFVPILYWTENIGEKVGFRQWPSVFKIEDDDIWDYFRTEEALREARQIEKAHVLPIFVKAQQEERYCHCSEEGCHLSEAMLAEGVYKIVEEIERMSKEIGGAVSG